MKTKRRSLIILLISLIFLSVTPLYALDARKIFSASKDSVVLIMSFDRNNQPLSIGSGFFVGNGKAIVTNYHVIEGASSLKVKQASGTILQIENILGVDSAHDLVLLQSPTKGEPLELTQRTPAVGDEIVSIGNPKGLEGTLSTGIVSGIRDDKGSIYYQTTAPISPGSSGGPVIDVMGKVVGVATFYVTGGQNLNFAMPSKYIAALLQSPSIKKLSSITGSRKPLRKLSADERVRVVEPFIDGLDGALQASIVNYTDNPIRNIRMVAVFYPRYKGIDPVHYLLIQVNKTIPPGLATRYDRNDKTLEWHGQNTADLRGNKGEWRVTFRILDYDVIETSVGTTLPTFQ